MRKVTPASPHCHKYTNTWCPEVVPSGNIRKYCSTEAWGKLSYLKKKKKRPSWSLLDNTETEKHICNSDVRLWWPAVLSDMKISFFQSGVLLFWWATHWMPFVLHCRFKLRIFKSSISQCRCKVFLITMKKVAEQSYFNVRKKNELAIILIILLWYQNLQI